MILLGCHGDWVGVCARRWGHSVSTSGETEGISNGGTVKPPTYPKLGRACQLAVSGVESPQLTPAVLTRRRVPGVEDQTSKAPWAMAQKTTGGKNPRSQSMVRIHSPNCSRGRSTQPESKRLGELGLGRTRESSTLTEY